MISGRLASKTSFTRLHVSNNLIHNQFYNIDRMNLNLSNSQINPLSLLQDRLKKLSAEYDENEETDRLFFKHQYQTTATTVAKQFEGKRKRTNTSGIMYSNDNTLTLRRATPTDSLWWINYVVIDPKMLSRRQLHKSYSQ